MRGCAIESRKTFGVAEFGTLRPRATSLVLLLPLGRAAVLHEVRDEVDGEREDDGGVLLRRDRVESLKRGKTEGS